MKFSLFAILAGAATFSFPAAASSQGTAALSIAAGPSIPIARFKDSQSNGFAAAVGVIFGSNDNPFGLRIEAGYDKLPERTTSLTVASGQRIISGAANVLFTFPGTLAKPYLSAGLGEYGMKSDTAGAKTATRFGFSFGSGVSFPLLTRSAFLEARLQNISQKNAKPLRYLQVLFGILL